MADSEAKTEVKEEVKPEVKPEVTLETGATVSISDVSDDLLKTTVVAIMQEVPLVDLSVKKVRTLLYYYSVR
jgi:hypothetical protein